METFSITAENLGKYYNPGKFIFQNITFSLDQSQVLIIKGKNGSGKTTLLKVLSGALKQSSGTLKYNYNSKEVNKENYYLHIGYIAPYLNIYEEFTPVELFQFYCKNKSIKNKLNSFEMMINLFNLKNRRNELIGTYSSGMKQKIKYCLAFSGNNSVIFLDEPFSNLDSEGIEVVKSLLKNHLESSGIIIIASNDEREYNIDFNKKLFINL